ncbi:unnamed protein product [Fasciola hepatica]|uniref:Uncharacterized protein n=1 Tax=Fasciola hepatica TaxID=6192 RepID=A0ABC9HHE9_FASHE
METVLDYTSKFVRQYYSDEPELEQEVSAEAHFLLEGHFTCETTAQHLKPNGTQNPQLYGSPKLHKPDVSLIQIQSMINSSQHELAKRVLKLFEIVDDPMARDTIKESFEIVEIFGPDNCGGETHDLI